MAWIIPNEKHKCVLKKSLGQGARIFYFAYVDGEKTEDNFGAHVKIYAQESDEQPAIVLHESFIIKIDESFDTDMLFGCSLYLTTESFEKVMEDWKAS